MKIAYHVAIIVVITVSTILFSHKPRYNWDLIPYVSCAQQFDTGKLESHRASAYEVIENEVPEGQIGLLKMGEYREACANEDNAFNEQLPYYTIKPAYNIMVCGAHKMGLPWTKATQAPSILSISFISIVFYFLLLQRLKKVLIPAMIALGITFLPISQFFIQISSPDALGAFLLFSSATLILSDKHSWVGFLLMPISVLARPDNIIWCALFLVLTTLMSRSNRATLILALGTLTVLISIHFMVGKITSNGGWRILFYNSFIERQVYPLTQTPDLGITQYLTVVIKNLRHLIPWLSVLALVLIAGKRKWLTHLKESVAIQIILVSWITLLLKFALFPSGDIRFYYSLIIITAVCYIKEANLINDILSQKRTSVE